MTVLSLPLPVFIKYHFLEAQTLGNFISLCIITAIVTMTISWFIGLKKTERNTLISVVKTNFIKMKLICEKELCTGCGLCAARCPKHSISLVAEELGHLYPSVDQKKCIDCGLCQKHAHRCMIRYVCIRQWHTPHGRKTKKTIEAALPAVWLLY